VVSRPKTGTRVRPQESWNLLDPDVLAWRQEGRPRGPFLGNLTEVRLLIEPGAAELAARRAGPAQLGSLQAALRDMRAALDLSPPDYEAYNEADIHFHGTTVQACDNDILEQFGAMVNTTLLVAFNAAIRVPGLARGLALAAPGHPRRHPPSPAESRSPDMRGTRPQRRRPAVR
jgi:DNA-binding FadR family transcriptional regulator